MGANTQMKGKMWRHTHRPRMVNVPYHITIRNAEAQVRYGEAILLIAQSYMETTPPPQQTPPRAKR